jgi:hypothetical protein
MREQEKNDSLGVAWRNVLALFGAFALLGQIKDFNIITWQHDLAVWIEAFKAFSRPVATFLFGWIPALFHLDFPLWMKDYLTVGVITVSAVIREWITKNGGEAFDIVSICLLLLYLVTWPIVIVMVVVWYIVTFDERERRYKRVFASVFVYAVLIIAINYAMIGGGAKTA